MKKIVGVSKWLILLLSLGGLGVAFYMHMKSNAQADITPVQKSTSSPKTQGISRVSMIGTNGHDNHAMSNDSVDKY